MTQDEPNYKALYTELKGEVLEKVGPFAKAANVKLCGEWRDDELFSQTDVGFYLTFGDLRAALALYDKLSSIEVFPELPGGAVKNAAGEGEGSGRGER